MTRRDRWILRAAAIWTVYVWGTRIWNIWRDDHDLAFKAVHTVLAVVSVAFAVAIWRVATRASHPQVPLADDAGLALPPEDREGGGVEGEQPALDRR